MEQIELFNILNKSSEYLQGTKSQYQNLHSYFVYLGISQRDYAKMLNMQDDGTDSYKNTQKAIDVIERAKEIIISNILQTQVLNPYAKNSNMAMQYLKVISREFKDEGQQQERLNIVIKSGNGPISLIKKGGN